MHAKYTLLTQIFETAESYESALEYHQKGIDEFAKAYPQASSTYLSTYGTRILCKGYWVSMIFMKGVWHYAFNPLL